MPRAVFLLLVSLATSVTAAAQHAAQTECSGERPQMITILHTNDIHGHLTAWRGWEGELEGQEVGGLDRLASVVASVRAERSPVLLLDAGDLIGDTMIAQRTEGRALLRVFNELQYDALTLGNHEPDFGSAILRERIAAAKFPVLACNVVRARDGELFARPYVAKELAGVKVGILGIAYPKTAWTTAAENVADLQFLDPVQSARRQIQAMRAEGVELIVALTHLGLGHDKRLAEQVPEIDVIVGGHSHNRMAEALEVGKTLIVQAGAHGSDVGRLDLWIEEGAVKEHRRELYPLTHRDVPSEPKVAQLMEEILAPHRQALEEPIGRAEAWLVRAQTLAGQEPRLRDAPSPVDSLFADLLRQETAADIAFLPGVGYGVAIPPGPVTAAQLRQLIPHDGNVVTMQLPGSRVIDVLEQAIENVFTDNVDLKVGGMIQVSGIRFAYDPALPRGQRVVEVQLEGGSWNVSKAYKVATSAMLAAGGHHQEAFAASTERTEHQSLYEVVKGAMQKQGTVAPPAEGRIRQLQTR